MAIAAPVPASWKASSHTVDIGGDIHYVDFGGPTGGAYPPIVLVHGLGGSYANWGSLGPLLAAHTRVFALDLVGFGMSHPAGRSGSVRANAEVVSAFLERVVGGPVLLVGNSMGGMISMLVASAHPEQVAGLVLLDPALPRVKEAPHDWQVVVTFAAFAVPGVGERLLRRRRLTTPARQAVADTLRLCSPHSEVVPEEMVEVAVDLIDARRDAAGLEKAYLQAARSLLRVMGRSRVYYALMKALPMPVMLCNGELDRLVPVEAARAAAARCPHWTFETFPDVGHVPMMEIPETVADRIKAWLPALSRQPAG